MIIGALWLAFFLRAYHLDFQSFWSDEGLSLWRSRFPPLQMIEQRLPVEHVPGYFVLLHYWLLLVGDSDFAVRFLSLLPSVLAIAVAYRLAADMGSRAAGLITALLLATNAFQLWYAQEARMYSWLMATSFLSSWFFWRMLTRPGASPWLLLVGYAATMTANIYLHYYGFLAPLAHAIMTLIWAVGRHSWRESMGWVWSSVIVGCLFLPWLPRALKILNHPGWREPSDPREIPWRYLTAYTVGDAMPEPWRSWLPWFYLALAIVGVMAWWKRSPMASAFLLAGVFAPMLGVVGLALRNPDFHERYTIFVSAPLLLLVGGALGGGNVLNRLVPRLRSLAIPLFSSLLIAGMVGANGLALYRLYTDTSLHKPDFRSAAHYIQEAEQKGDIVVVDGPNPEILFKHYYHGAAPVYDLRFLEDADSKEVGKFLAEITAGQRRVWELMFFRRPGPIQVWLATHAWAAAPSYHNDIRVSLYGLADKPLIEQPIHLFFGPELELVSVGISDRSLQAGELLRISTTWQTHHQSPDYKFSLRMQDADGQVAISKDYIPQNWFAPTSLWIIGQQAVDQHAILLPRDWAAGSYRVTLRLYDPATGIPVTTASGQDVILAEIQTVAP